MAGQSGRAFIFGPGDFTHPEWLEEIGNTGRGRLGALRPGEEAPLRFCLQPVETSLPSIDKPNRLHLLITAPGLKKLETCRVPQSFRPEFGRTPAFQPSCSELVERILQASPQSMQIPRHILTPMNSPHGSRLAGLLGRVLSGMASKSMQRDGHQATQGCAAPQ
jgi:PHP family Zn ribbon phosphoesterase